jgi:hypothetical protein
MVLSLVAKTVSCLVRPGGLYFFYLGSIAKVTLNLLGEAMKERDMRALTRYFKIV